MKQLLILFAALWTLCHPVQGVLAQQHSLRSQSKKVKTIEGLSNEQLDSIGLDSFGFEGEESKLSERAAQQLERYRQGQRKLGFERAGRGVDVKEGFEAAGKRRTR